MTMPTTAQMRQAASEAATIKMAGEALEALTDRQWLDVVLVSAEERLRRSPAAVRELAQHLDRRVDEVQR